MLNKFSLSTQNQQLHDITVKVKEAILQSGINDGICVVYCPHTTAGITINENADPDVVKDILLGLDKAFPENENFRHFEGNSTAHLKASCVGPSVTVIVKKNKPILGTWQSIYFCEFDGPRTRTFYVKTV